MSRDLSWRPAPPNLVLPDGVVHIWRVRLDQLAGQTYAYADILSADELGRAERLYSETKREDFVNGRGVLRTILSLYLGMEPAELQFRYGTQGKPELASQPGDSRLRFNLSHSHRLALYAFVWNRAVGIDLERVRPLPDVEHIAARVYGEREQSIFGGLPQDQKLEAFFEGWTCKEAYIKALGTGLAQPLRQVEVAVTGDEPARLVSVDGDADRAASWSLRTLTPAAGYKAAVIVEGQDVCCRCWRYRV